MKGHELLDKCVRCIWFSSSYSWKIDFLLGAFKLRKLATIDMLR